MLEQVTLFTKAEVAANNGQNNTRLWMVINNGVYDLTEFMHQVIVQRDMNNYSYLI